MTSGLMSWDVVPIGWGLLQPWHRLVAPPLTSVIYGAILRTFEDYEGVTKGPTALAVVEAGLLLLSFVHSRAGRVVPWEVFAAEFSLHTLHMKTGLKASCWGPN